jgi:cell division protein FtsL
MTNTTQTKVNILDIFRENFSLVVAIVSIIGSWAFFQFQANDHEKRISKLEVNYMQQNTDISDIKGTIKEINAKLDLLLNNKIRNT